MMSVHSVALSPRRARLRARRWPRSGRAVPCPVRGRRAWGDRVVRWLSGCHATRRVTSHCQVSRVGGEERLRRCRPAPCRTQTNRISHHTCIIRSWYMLSRQDSSRVVVGGRCRAVSSVLERGDAARTRAGDRTPTPVTRHRSPDRTLARCGGSLFNVIQNETYKTPPGAPTFTWLRAHARGASPSACRASRPLARRPNE